MTLHWFVHKADFGDLRLVLHSLVSGANSDTAHERSLWSAVLRAISWGRYVLVCNIKMTCGRTNAVGHVLRGSILDVQLVKS